MRIDRLEVYYVALPLIYPWKTAYGEDADIHSVLVRMSSGDQEGAPQEGLLVLEFQPAPGTFVDSRRKRREALRAKAGHREAWRCLGAGRGK
jgi:hypothetical protein